MTSNATVLQSKANPQQLEAILATDGPVLICSGQPIPDSGLSFSSATAGGNPSLN